MSFTTEYLKHVEKRWAKVLKKALDYKTKFADLAVIHAANELQVDISPEDISALAEILLKETWVVKHDGKIMFQGSKDECWVWILKHQSQSVSWAMKNGGYQIVKKEKKSTKV